MAQSPSPDVQRHAARAFWHLAVHHENKRHILEMGGAQSLLLLSRLGERNLQACLLAEEALRRLSEDPEVANELARERDGLDGPIIVSGGLGSLVPTTPAPPRGAGVDSSPATSPRTDRTKGIGVESPETPLFGARGVKELVQSPATASPRSARAPAGIESPQSYERWG